MAAGRAGPRRARSQERSGFLARQLGIPRSQLYARALRQYFEEHSPGHITAALDAVYEGVDSSLAADLAAAQAQAVGKEAR